MAPADNAATISSNGDDAAAGSRTDAASLTEGHNRFTIVVTPHPLAAGDQPLAPITYTA